jgi:hypothetical protein
MPRLFFLVAVLFLAAPALAEEAERARDLARAALLEGATVPLAAEMPGTIGDHAGAHHALPSRRVDPEHEAHVRAAQHGTRHSREARPAHAGEAAGGPMHGGAAGPGMDEGADCHDAASNRRTRGMHDGGGDMDPGHPGGMGMKTAPFLDPAGARGGAR